MNDDRDNSNIQSSSKGSSTGVNASSEEKDTLASEQSIETDKEVNSSEEKDTLLKKNSSEEKTTLDILTCFYVFQNREIALRVHYSKVP